MIMQMNPIMQIMSMVKWPELRIYMDSRAITKGVQEPGDDLTKQQKKLAIALKI